MWILNKVQKTCVKLSSVLYCILLANKCVRVVSGCSSSLIVRFSRSVAENIKTALNELLFALLPKCQHHSFRQESGKGVVVMLKL